MDNINEEFWSALDKLVSESEIVIDRPKGSAHPKLSTINFQLSIALVYIEY